MKFKLKCILIDTKPRTGYYIANNKELVAITKIDNKREICKLSNGNQISIEEASHVVAKLIGETTHGEKQYTYSIVHGDYPILINSLNSEYVYDKDVELKDRLYSTYAEAVIDGATIECEGEFETILSKTEPEEVVEIINIDIIDKYSLYDKVDRLGVVKVFDKAKQNFTIKMNKLGLGINEDTIVCKRKDFKKVHVTNTISMIHVKCPYCKR